MTMFRKVFRSHLENEPAGAVDPAPEAASPPVDAGPASAAAAPAPAAEPEADPALLAALRALNPGAADADDGSGADAPPATAARPPTDDSLEPIEDDPPLVAEPSAPVEGDLAARAAEAHRQIMAQQAEATATQEQEAPEERRPAPAEARAQAPAAAATGRAAPVPSKAAPQQDATQPDAAAPKPDAAAPKPMRRPAGRARTRLLGFNAAAAAPDPFAAAAAAAPEETPDSPTDLRTHPTGWIVVTEGPGQGNYFAVFNGVAMIGRGEDQAIRLDFGDMAISRQNHAAIAYDSEDNKFYLGHGGKSNIIRLNDRPVLSTEELSNGDTIRIGETVLRFSALCGPDFQWGSGSDD